MSHFEIIIIIFASIVLFTCIISIMIVTTKQKISELLFKINESENLIINSIKKKHENLIRIINIIEKKLKISSKTLDNVKSINIENFNKLETDNTLENIFEEVKVISSDYPKLSNNKSFNELTEELNKNEIQLISLRTFYNEMVTKYNSLLKTFPSNIISKFNNYEFKNFLEGQELEDKMSQ